MESWAIKAMQAKLMDGRLDQMERTLVVNHCAARLFSQAQWATMRSREPASASLSVFSSACVSASVSASDCVCVCVCVCVCMCVCVCVCVCVGEIACGWCKGFLMSTWTRVVVCSCGTRLSFLMGVKYIFTYT